MALLSSADMVSLLLLLVTSPCKFSAPHAKSVSERLRQMSHRVKPHPERA
jgi:hypothetical protein